MKPDKFNYEFRQLPIADENYFTIQYCDGCPGNPILYFRSLQEIRDYIFENDEVYLDGANHIRCSYLIRYKEGECLDIASIFSEDDFYSNEEWKRIVK